MEYKKFTADIAFNPAHEHFEGVVRGASQELTFHGKSVAELKTRFHQVIDQHLANCHAKNQPPYRKFSGKIHLRLHPAQHQQAFIAAHAAGKSLNQWIEDAIAERIAPSGRK